MSEFQTSWEDFKRMAKEFCDAAPTLNLEELDNAWKCLAIGYLNMNESMWEESAKVVLQMSFLVFNERESELCKQSALEALNSNLQK